MKYILLVFTILFLTYASSYRYSKTKMPDSSIPNSNDESQSPHGKQEKWVDLNGKQVPLSSIARPPHFLVSPKDHQPILKFDHLPNIEPEVKEREEERAKEQERSKGHKKNEL